MVGVGLAIVFVFSQGDDDGGLTVPSTERAAAPSRETPRRVAAPAAGAGSQPGRAAPAIPESVWGKAGALYREAAGLWNDGQEARGEGNSAEYQRAVLDSWAVLEKLYAAIEPYTDWFEEADLEGWEMPADYDRLQGRLDVWDSLRAKVRKMKPIKRR